MAGKPRRVFLVCKDILALSDEQLTEIDEMAKGQQSTIKPLKMATQGRINALGNYNAQVATKLRDLRDFMKSNPPA